MLLHLSSSDTRPKACSEKPLLEDSVAVVVVVVDLFHDNLKLN